MRSDRKILRRELKKIYKKQKRQDVIEFGKPINELIQVLLKQYKLNADKRDPELIESCMKEVSELRKHKRTKDEFPTFSAFRKYIVKEKVTLTELRDIN